MKMQTKGTAVIIGGGLAGLLIGRTLSDFYEEVIIVERDELLAGPTYRPGTPQAYHPHRLLERGKMILEGFFPGYVEDLLAYGAFSREQKKVLLTNSFGSLKLVDDKDAGCSRALLEWTIRQRVKQFANVRFLGMQEVTGLLTSADQSRITGIHLRERGQSGQRQMLMADLVVDASGSSSKLIKWLHALGYGAPETERLIINLGYSTRHYLIPPHLQDQWSVIVSDSYPAQGIGAGVLGPIEDGLAELLLYRAGGESYPSVNGKEIVEEATRLLNPRIAELLPQLEAVAEPRGFRMRESLRHHFETMEKWPTGLLVVGDALCNFDPIYGQGITVAAMEAEILAACLQEERDHPRPDFERKALQRMQAAIEAAWWLSAVAGLRWRGVEYIGSQPLKGVKFAQKFLDLCLEQAFGHGNMEFFKKYFMMTTLFVSPRAVINAETVNTLLALDKSGKAQQLCDEFLGGDKQGIEEALDQLLPSFDQFVIPMPAATA